MRPPRRSAHAAVSSQPTARRPVDELTNWARVFRNSRRRCHPRPLPLVGSSGGFRLAAKALAPASVGVVHTIALVKSAAVYEGISMIETRARKAVNGEGQAHG